MALTKTELRQYHREARRALDPELRTRWSAQIRQRVLEDVAWKKARAVLIYVSFGSEVETHALLADALHAGKQLIVPLVGEAREWPSLSALRRIEDLSESRIKGILEPALGAREKVDPALIDLALVPGLAFDRRGGRLGMGGGFYDRMLPQVKGATFLALCYSSQLQQELLPREPHDVLMHAVVTEKEWLTIT